MPTNARRIATVRAFNRFYTRRIGVLQEGLLESPLSLTEVRVLWELANHETSTATGIGAELGLDAGYLSRVLRRLRKQGLIARKRSPDDGRQSLLWLTDRGRVEFAKLNAAADAEIETLLGALPEENQRRVVDAMRTIETMLGGTAGRKVPYILRPPRAGDLGWIVQRHGAVYAREQGWDDRFEGLVAGIVSRFVRHHDPKRERCWIAEIDGENVGSVCLVKKTKTIAQLRMLLVEPQARGLGIGARLVDECVRFARDAGYRRIILWTDSVLLSARRIYEGAGFELTREEPHDEFGNDLIGQVWEMEL
jgi:DNA-binding MarR family transcriptional regulator/GNAT superfamily N-acetyltransferase